MITKRFFKYFYSRLKSDGVKGLIRYYFSRRFINYKIWQFRNMRLRQSERICFKDATTAELKRLKKRVIIYTVLWGDYIELYLSYGLPALFQDGNIPNLVNKGYSIKHYFFTKTDDDKKRIQNGVSSLKSFGENGVEASIVTMDEAGCKNTNDLLIKTLIETFRECIETNAVFFVSSSDVICGNKSLSNGIELVREKGVCLAAAAPRVDTEKILAAGVLDGLKNGTQTLENADLVRLAFQFPHPILAHSFDNKDVNNTKRGMSVRKIGEDMYSVIHNVQDPFVVNPRWEDIEFFEFDRTFTNYDRTWVRILFNECRLKFVGSSDLFFLIELTKENENFLDLQKDSLNNDKLKNPEKMGLGHHIYNTCYCCWRASKGK